MYFLNINKPKGISSFDVIRELRKKLKIKKIGHSGTLDPLASGVLQVAVGKATRLLDYLSSDKKYITEIKFGYTTNTYDNEGEKKFIKIPDFNKDDLLNVLDDFIGSSIQIPPKYSAIKINGKKACEIARNSNDEEIEIKPRNIEIYSIKLLDFSNDTAKIEVFCKKGTYIRTLVNDIGKKLGCGAYVKELIRIQAGSFKISTSDNLDQDYFHRIDPIDTLNIDKIEISQSEYLKIINGNFIQNKTNLISGNLLLTKNNKLVSLSKIDDNIIKPIINFKEE